MAFEVHKGIPMPAPNRGVKKYPFDQMDVNDMFFVPLDENGDITALQKKVSSSASMTGKRSGKRFATQIVKEDDNLGVGVWRVE
jgi:hypothetical protein